MLRYVAKRIALMIPVILGVLLIVFAISRLAGDPVLQLLGSDATEEEYGAMYKSLGLDKPFVAQFARYVGNVATSLDFGLSYITKRPVRDEILRRLPITFSLASISVAAAVFIGILFGVVCAMNQNKTIDYVLTLVSLVAASMPDFWVALMLILLFAVRLNWLPATGLESWTSWLMPCMALGMAPIASLCRTTRSSMLEVIRQDYIRTARAKGISEKKVIFKHALKNAVFPVITVAGFIVSVSIGGAVVIETVFTIPGIGTYMMTAITSSDYPAIQGTVLVLSLLVCVVNLLVDIAYGFADPRIRAKYARRRKGKRERARAAGEAA